MNKRNKLLIAAILIIIAICTTGAFSIDYGNIKFSDFKSKAFSANAGSGSYYDSFTIYYKSYDYKGNDCISEYYFTGKKSGKTEVIMYACFENRNNQLTLVRYDGKGKEVMDIPVAGFLHTDSPEKYNDTNLEVFGFSTDIFSSPLTADFLFVFTGDDAMLSDSVWPLDYDYKQNILKEWNPE